LCLELHQPLGDRQFGFVQIGAEMEVGQDALGAELGEALGVV